MTLLPLDTGKSQSIINRPPDVVNLTDGDGEQDPELS